MSAERVQCADAASRPNEPQLENTQIIIDARGELVATYVKTHLADIYVPLVRFRLAESKLFRHGSRLVPPVQTPIGKLGLLTVRSPSHSLTLSFSRVHCSLFTVRLRGSHLLYSIGLVCACSATTCASQSSASGSTDRAPR